MRCEAPKGLRARVLLAAVSDEDGNALLDLMHYWCPDHLRQGHSAGFYPWTEKSKGSVQSSAAMPQWRARDG